VFSKAGKSAKGEEDALKILRIIVSVMIGVTSVLLFFSGGDAVAAPECTPTPHDEIGPFYRPNAPVRSVIGTGYVLQGGVRDSSTCRPVAGARIEFWQAGPGGVYGDAYRATVYSDPKGRYRLETFLPPPYARRPAHIHILVDMRGYAGLITQHYPKSGEKQSAMDLVMERE
jgi:protocatechuate 3,4-dioxygenase beta subunit